MPTFNTVSDEVGATSGLINAWNPTAAGWYNAGVNAYSQLPWFALGGLGELGDESGMSAFFDTGLTGDTGGDIIGAGPLGYNAVRVADYGKYVAPDIEVYGGKVAGKIPTADYVSIRKASVLNPDSGALTLGSYDGGGATSYITKANGSSYFDVGKNWNGIKQAYKLNETDMFNLFNKPALDDAIKANKTIRFSHDPREVESWRSLHKEWEYIKQKLNLTDSDLISQGGYWYVK